jgi:N-dimethylarginine dimethylaminohydrolase
MPHSQLASIDLHIEFPPSLHLMHSSCFAKISNNELIWLAGLFREALKELLKRRRINEGY